MPTRRVARWDLLVLWKPATSQTVRKSVIGAEGLANVIRAGVSGRNWSRPWWFGWPGLVRLWKQGSRIGFLWAVAAALCLNATLVAWLIWPEWLRFPVPHVLISVTFVVWVSGGLDGIRAQREMRARSEEDPHLDLFLSARTEYLRGHWLEADRLLVQLLESSPEDAEARLLRATLLRHAGRQAEARDQLRRLQRWNRAAIWNLEIGREWDRLSRPAMQSARHVPVGPLLPARSQRGASATSAHLHVFPTASETLKDVA